MAREKYASMLADKKSGVECKEERKLPAEKC
jgi:hypothetical protein